MSVNEKMTALADEVRRLSGAEGKLGIEAMTERLSGVKAGGGGGEKFKQLAGGNLIELTSEDLEGVTKLRKYAFYDIPTLQSVKIADTDIKVLSDYCFANSNNIEVLELPKGLTKIGYDTFGSGANYMLTKLIIPKTVTEAGFQFGNAFKALKTIEFEEGSQFAILGNYSISGMDSLTHIKFHRPLAWCNTSFCRMCPSLQYLDFTSCTAVSALGSTSEVFGGTTPSTAKVIVPASLYDKWIKATNWANFADRIVPDTINGTWVFNDTITWERTFAQSVNFNTNSENKAMLRWSLDSTNEGNYYLRYGTTHKAYSTNTQTWDNANYKTVSFGDTPQTCNAEFLAFMYHNATKQ